MFLGPFTLLDIVKRNDEEIFQICVISFDISESLKHTLTLNYQPLDNNSLETCKNKNDRQVELLHFSLIKLKLFLK